jgi:NAD(P)-dependent dehydrogenase (short-subunit alcohol dehydrogenase family)
MALLEGKVAVITGGASGIGEGTVRKFVAEGARVVVSDVQDARGEKLAEELGPNASKCARPWPTPSRNGAASM